MTLMHSSQADNGDLAIFENGLSEGQHEFVLKVDHGPACLEYNNIEIGVMAACDDLLWTTQYREELVGSQVQVVYPEWDNETLSFTEETEATGVYTSYFSFSVSWADQETTDRRRLARRRLLEAELAPPARSTARHDALLALVLFVVSAFAYKSHLNKIHLEAALQRHEDTVKAELRQTRQDIAALIAQLKAPAL